MWLGNHRLFTLAIAALILPGDVGYTIVCWLVGAESVRFRPATD